MWYFSCGPCAWERCREKEAEMSVARIDLFHGGMSRVREIAILAKYFPGVHLSMSWMHFISPARSAFPTRLA